MGVIRMTKEINGEKTKEKKINIKNEKTKLL